MSVFVCASERVRAARTSVSESEELEEEEEEEESLELSEAMPVDSWRSTLSAKAARSGRSCFSTLRETHTHTHTRHQA